ncbi:MAG TPA: hypothetical protein VLT82_11485 [Myxococcaceae bacterium]|nr:hypothetical protein [Myxococcaceae bacterium]
MPGRLPGTFSYVQATRLVTQPTTAVFGGRLHIAVNSSTSPYYGDPSAGSEIRVLYSPNGGKSWVGPASVAPSTSREPQHVHPSIDIGGFGSKAYVGYYVQQADERLRTDIATVEPDGKKLEVQRDRLSSVAFDLTPSNIIRTVSPRATTNYDRLIASCYNIGEYMSVNAPTFWGSDDRVTAAWGDNRRTWTGPAGPPPSSAPYTHAQPDVFFGHAGGD